MTACGSKAARAIGDDIAAYREQGLQPVLIGGYGLGLDGTLEHLERFSGEVMAKLN